MIPSTSDLDRQEGCHTIVETAKMQHVAHHMTGLASQVSSSGPWKKAPSAKISTTRQAVLFPREWHGFGIQW